MKRTQKKSKIPNNSEPSVVQKTIIHPILSQRKVIQWGMVATALIAIIGAHQIITPIVMNYLSSDPPPYEGKLEHNKDIGDKIKPLQDTINRVEATSSTITVQLENLERKGEQRDLNDAQNALCIAVDRLTNVRTRIKLQPDDTLALESLRMRRAEVARLKQKIIGHNAIPQCELED